MAWLGEYLGYGKKLAADNSELKLLREDKALRSKVQGERFIFSARTAHILISPCRGYQACSAILVQDVALGLWW